MIHVIYLQTLSQLALSFGLENFRIASILKLELKGAKNAENQRMSGAYSAVCRHQTKSVLNRPLNISG